MIEKEKAKWVEMVAKDNKRQMIEVFARSLLGDLLQHQLIIWREDNTMSSMLSILECYFYSKLLVKWRNYERVL